VGQMTPASPKVARDAWCVAHGTDVVDTHGSCLQTRAVTPGSPGSNSSQGAEWPARSGKLTRAKKVLDCIRNGIQLPAFKWYLSTPPEWQGIRKVADFSARYRLGREVMPLDRSGTALHFATRLGDGLSVVVKVRRKWARDAQSSFSGKGEEADFRASSELMLGLPWHRPGFQYVGRLFEVLEDDSSYFIVMERCQGMDLFDTLLGRSSGRSRTAKGRFGTDEIRQIIRQLATALGALHAGGCLHRDMKLENVMVQEGSVGSGAGGLICKIVDFDDVCAAQKGDCTGQCVVGTDQYIAPEAYSGNYSPSSDVFSLGVIFYRLLFDRFPFHSSTFDDQPGENVGGSLKMENVRRGVQRARIDWSLRRTAPEAQAVALCRAMMDMSCSKRPSVADVLLDPWLSGCDPSQVRGAASPKASASEALADARGAGIVKAAVGGFAVIDFIEIEDVLPPMAAVLSATPTLHDSVSPLNRAQDRSCSKRPSAADALLDPWLLGCDPSPVCGAASLKGSASEASAGVRGVGIVKAAAGVSAVIDLTEIEDVFTPVDAVPSSVTPALCEGRSFSDSVVARNRAQAEAFEPPGMVPE